MKRYIDRSLELCYMGYRGNEPTGEISRLLCECEELLCKIAKPRYIFKVYGKAECPLPLDSQALERHLEGCDRVILFAATLGNTIDAEIRSLSITDMTKATILDACANAFIERYGEECDAELSRLFEGSYLTWRYSPGYEGFDISNQKVLTELLDTNRKLGLSASRSLMLTPLKSVTAVIGVSKKPIPQKRRGCAVCDMRERCNFRKEGMHCGF